MKVSRYGNLLHMYYGSRIPDEDLDYLLTFSDRGFSPNPYEAGNDRLLPAGQAGFVSCI